EAGKMDLYLETFDVARLLEEISTTVQPLVQKNSNSYEVRCPPDIGLMRADMTKVRQSLLNIISNASKFTKSGKVMVEARRATDSNDASWIVFDVSDTGIGITREQQARVFEA